MADLSLVEAKTFAAFLFDMDGTILTSTVAAERVWSRWAEGHGIDVAAFLPTMHGRRAIDTINSVGLVGIDAEHEAMLVSEAEIADVEGITAISGAPEFLASLPADRWAIVTSAPRELARVRLAAAGITAPTMIISAEDVTRGKPMPDCYLLAAERMGVAIADCLIFEDAPAGIAAAEASGAAVLVISATHRHVVETPHATIADYNEVMAVSDASRLRLVSQRPG